MLKPANSLPSKPAVAETHAMSLEDYIGGRIQSSVDNGYSSCKCWVKNENVNNAVNMLGDNGYKIAVLVKEPSSTQLEISW